MWPNEAQNFTPWLAENIAELGEKIGMELEVVGQEVSVGPYSADILAKDIDTDAYVVIENQLEKTNHDHLGKSITYASALGAKTIVWIATDFTVTKGQVPLTLNRPNTITCVASTLHQRMIWRTTA